MPRVGREQSVWYNLSILYWEVKEMNIKTKIIVVLSVLFLLLLLLNHYMSYSMRIGDTNFYLVETMAMSEEGDPLLGLYHKDINDGYKGVEMSGFPKIILWNEKYLISKNYDGNVPTITSYVIICQDSVNISDGDIAGILLFKTEIEYNNYMKQIGVSESKMNQIDNRITWWKLLLKSKIASQSR